jgi:transcriptional regulator of acetoin/glycerol metabolism
MLHPFASPVGSPVQLEEEYQLARKAHVNLMLVHSEGTAHKVTELILPELINAVTTWSPGESLDLPADSTGGTIVLRDVNALPFRDQLRLLEWLDPAPQGIQVISTTQVSLHERVETGEFIDALFYRLNVVTVEVAA